MLLSTWLQGIARTQSPTHRNYAVEIPTFREFAGVNKAAVQWQSLALGEPPSWSWCLPCQVSMTPCLQRQAPFHTKWLLADGVGIQLYQITTGPLCLHDHWLARCYCVDILSPNARFISYWRLFPFTHWQILSFRLNLKRTITLCTPETFKTRLTLYLHSSIKCYLIAWTM